MTHSRIFAMKSSRHKKTMLVYSFLGVVLLFFLTGLGCQPSPETRILRKLRVFEVKGADGLVERMVIKKVVSSGDQYAIFFEVGEEDFQAICSNLKWLPLTPDRAFEMKPGHYVEGLRGYYTEFSQDGILSYLVVLDDNKTIVAIRAGAFY